MTESLRALLISIAGLMDDRRQEGGRWDEWEASVRERIAAELIADAAAPSPRLRGEP